VSESADRPSSTSAFGSPHVAECWADLARALTLYPATNSRVQRSLGAFLAALRAIFDAGPKRFELAFSARKVWVGETSFALKPGGNLVWLKERLDRAHVSGASFSAEVDEAALLAFTQRLLDLFARRDLEQGFAELWSEPFRGVVPLERRFEGAFSERETEGNEEDADLPSIAGRSRHKQESLRNALTMDPRVRAKLEEVRASFDARAAQGSELGRIDLVEQIVGLLPAEGLHDYETAVEMSLSMIQAVLADPAPGPAASAPNPRGDAGLRDLLLTVGRSHFASLGAVPRAPEAPASRDEERNPTILAASYDRASILDEDAAITDDLQALLAEIERECPVAHGPIRGTDCEDPVEELGVFLHFLAASDDPSRFPGMRAGIERLLQVAGEPGLELVRTYLLATDDAAAGDRARALRVATWLRRNKLHRVLRACGVLDERWVAREFPVDFLEYLGMLDLASVGEREELDRVCRAIGAKRFGAATELMDGAEEFLSSELVTRLFALNLVSLAPLVRQIYERDKWRFRGELARYLRAILAKGIDQAILDLVEDGPCLSASYLNALAQRDTGKLPELRLQTLRAFLASTAEDASRLPQFVRAVKLLANFDAPEQRAFLQRLVEERRGLVFHRHPREVREAARAVLQWFQKREEREKSEPSAKSETAAKSETSEAAAKSEPTAPTAPAEPSVESEGSSDV
jgi:hypothetical protein